MILALAICLATQTAYPQWGYLRPGPHAVGFRIVEAYDKARSYNANRNYGYRQGQDGNGTRPNFAQQQE